MLRNKLFIYGDEITFKLPAHVNFGKHMLQKFCAFKDTIAITNVDNDESFTYGELAQRAVDTALSLARMGVRKGEVVGICSERRREFMPTVFGIICAGAVFAPADISCGRATILHRINIAKPKVMFCSPAAYTAHRDTLKTVDSIKTIIVFGDNPAAGAVLFKDFLTEHASVEEFFTVPVEGWKDPAYILYSSGTTGQPKGIPTSHMAALMLVDCSTTKGSFAGKRFLMTREWYYSYGFGQTIHALQAGAIVYYSPSNQLEDILRAIQKYKIEVIQVAPATVVEMVKSSTLPDYDVTSLQVVVSCSTPLYPELIEELQNKFKNLRGVLEYYGMSEIGCVCNPLIAPHGPRAGSVGCVIANTILKVVDIHTREALGPHRRGELCVKSPKLTLGYIGDTTFSHLDEDGFFKTGDIGYYDEDQYVYIVDRIKELIKFNSFQVAPAELEAVLLQHAAVRDAGVAGVRDERLGELPAALVVLQPGAKVCASELLAYVDDQVSSRMRLAGGVHIADALPRGAGTKLDRSKLKETLTELVRGKD